MLRRGSRPGRGEIEEAALGLAIRHGAQILATARRYAATPEDAEDAYQRAFEILLTKAPTTSEDELVPWLKTVVRNEAIAVSLVDGPPGQCTSGIPGRDLVVGAERGDKAACRQLVDSFLDGSSLRRAADLGRQRRDAVDNQADAHDQRRQPSRLRDDAGDAPQERQQAGQPQPPSQRSYVAARPAWTAAHRNRAASRG